MQNNLKKTMHLISGGLRYDPQVFLRYCAALLFGSPATKINKLPAKTFLEQLQQGRSFIRMGDGEVLLITGRDIHFQPTSADLSNQIKTIIREYSDTAPYILGAPTNKLPLTEHELGGRSKIRIWRLYRVLFPLRFPTQASYAPLTQFYTNGYFEQHVAPMFRDRHVICITKASILNESFTKYMNENFAAASFVTTSSHDAYSEYDRIVTETEHAIKQSDRTPLILGAAGPATKVLAYEFTQHGVQCLDLGHGMELIANDKDRSYKI